MPVQSTVDIDPTFERRLAALRGNATANGFNLYNGFQVYWNRPSEEYRESMYDYAKLHALFERKNINARAVDAVKDAKNPGTSGDIVAATTMISVLSALERAYALRMNYGKVRRAALVAGRKLGHGAAGGPIVQNILEYTRRLVRQAKGQR